MTAVPIPHPAASRHAFRAQVCRLVERLIAMLDEIDGDPDQEPSLSFTGHLNQDLAIRTEPQGLAVERDEIDLEEACEDEGAFDGDNDTSDHEASLCGVGFSAPRGVYRAGEMHYDLEPEVGA